MLSIKRTQGLLLVAVIVATGCSGARPKALGTAGQAPAEAFEPIAIPDTMPNDETGIWEKTLYLLPYKHPDRRILRDRIVTSIAQAFKRLKEDAVSARLALFERALALHHPRDFNPGRIAPDMAPMASWIVGVFEQRGDEATVLASLRLLMMIDPNDTTSKEKYLDLYEWSASVRQTIPHPVDRHTSLIDLYRRMVQLVPDREVVEHVAELYVMRHQLITSDFQGKSKNQVANMPPLQMLMQGRILQSVPIDLIYIFFLAGDPAGARPYLNDLATEGGRIVDYLALLDRIFQGIDVADNYFTLANHLARVDTRASLKAAIAARAADRTDPRFPLYIGSLYDDLDRPECAFEFYVEAATIAPDEDVYISVLEMFRRSLLKVHMKELDAATARAIELGDALIDQATELFPGEGSDVKLVVASVLYMMGDIEFDNGAIDASRRHLARSFEEMPNVRALIKLSEVHYLLGEFNRGIEVLDEALGTLPDEQPLSAFWQAILQETRGDLMFELGLTKDAKMRYSDALKQWDVADVGADRAPLAAIRRGMIHDKLGNYPASREAFHMAVRLDPDREATYAQILSFLVIQSRLDDAKAFYRLAYNQDQIENIWKIYYSLWIEGLSLRTENSSFDLAQGYLKHSNGDTWQDNLAQYYSGNMPVETLREKAANVGQRVEVDYYAAVVAMAEGNIEQARTMLKRVIASKLLGYYEYRMANELLRRDPDLSGAPK